MSIIGRLAPYPVWLTMTFVVRGAQLGFLACCIWYLSALFDAMDRSWTISPPPTWLWIVTAILGVRAGRGRWIWKLSPVGDWIADLFAPHYCPSCGQDIYDHTTGQAYASELDRQSFLPSPVCTNCGHDLTAP